MALPHLTPSSPVTDAPGPFYPSAEERERLRRVCEDSRDPSHFDVRRLRTELTSCLDAIDELSRQNLHLRDALRYLPDPFEIEPEEGELLEVSWRTPGRIEDTILDAAQRWRERDVFEDEARQRAREAHEDEHVRHGIHYPPEEREAS